MKPLDIQSLHANYQPIDIPQYNQPQSVAPAHKGPGGLAGFLINNLPSIAGGIGLVGGEILNPFGGGIIGGAGASAAGEALKEKLLGRSLSPKQIAIQAGETAALGGIGKGFSAARAGSRALLGKTAPEALNTAKTATGLTTKVANVGESLKGEARGIKPGIPVPGTSNRLLPAQADKLNQYLDSIGATKSAHKQVRVVAADLEATGNKISNLVSQFDRPVVASDRQSILQTAASKAKNAIGLNTKDQVLTDAKRQIASARSLADLKQVRTNLDETLKNFYKQTERDSSTTATMKVIKGYRDGVDRVLSKSIPGFKEANTKYSLGLKAQDLLNKNANPPGFTLFRLQTGVGGEGIQGAKDLTGRALQKVAGAKPSPTIGANVPMSGVKNRVLASTVAPILGSPKATAGSVIKQMAGRGAGNAINSYLNPSPQATNGNPQDLTSALTLANSPQNMSAGTPQDSRSPYPIENLQADIQRDPKNGDFYMKLYQFYQDQLAAQQPKPLNSTAAGTVTDLENGIANLSQLSDQFNSSDVNSPLFGRIRGLNPFDTNAQSLQANIARVKQVIGKALEGGVLRKEDEVKYAKILPTIHDTDAVAQQKIDAIMTDLQRKLGLYQQSLGRGGGGTDLASALSQLQ